MAMAEAAGKEETTPGTLKEKAEESEGIMLLFVFVGLISRADSVYLREVSWGFHMSVSVIAVLVV